MRNDPGPAGQRALVIGGTGGIGRAAAIRLASMGAAVCVHGGSSRERLERTLAEIRSAGAVGEGFLCAIDQAQQIVEPIRARMPFSIVVVAFGPYLRASLADTTVEDWRRMSELNLALPGAVISLCAPAMREVGYGRFVLFGGPRTDGIEAFREIAAYAAAKTGLACLVRSAARQLNRYGITVNAICPGYVATEYYEAGQLEALVRRMPDGKLVQPEEVARVVEMLVQPDSGAINGALIRLDKGL